MSTPVCHLEINVKNLARAKKFYGGLMGWKFRVAMPGYLMASLDKNTGVALSKGKTAKAGMLPYFHVKSIDLTLKKVAKLKGKVAVAKTSIGGDYGFMAIIADTEGNQFGIWNSK